MKFKDELIKMNACEEAIEWVSDKTMEEAWETCERGDWMLWLFSRKYPNKKRERVLAAGHCANLVRHLMKDKRSKKAVDTAIAYGNGKATLEDLQSDAADAIDAAYAIDAAAGAADAAAAAAYAAAYAADAAANYAAYAADSAKKEMQKNTADVCRKYLKI